MDEERQRIKIAEACGWVDIRAEVDWLPKELTGIWTWPHPTDAEKTKYFISRKPVPNYLYDLNAMHRAENAFIGNASLAMTFAMHLLRINGQNISSEDDDLNCDHAWITAHATAAQHAEAFLKTLNLWEE